MITGHHLVAGEWLDTEEKFENMPIEGAALSFSTGTIDIVNRACEAAHASARVVKNLARQERAEFLRAIAVEIEARGDQLDRMASNETGLPMARIAGERGRTTGQLRLFADVIEDGSYLDRRHDESLPDRAPAPRPEMFLMQQPIGPVAVFGASNFPLAFSVAGGDTASALAAGCPVVVKGHSAHPGTSDIVAQAIDAAIRETDVPEGIFSMVQGGARGAGQALVTHPHIKAVGFTGSTAGGRALFDLCAARPSPIPFFGELGSINPVFALPAALSDRAESLAEGWAASLQLGAGQFCTSPGVFIAIDSPEIESFVGKARELLQQGAEQKMLTDGIASTYYQACQSIQNAKGVKTLLSPTPETRTARPFLATTTGDNWLSNENLAIEMFGPAGQIIRVTDEAQMYELATALEGQLTCTLLMDEADKALGRDLLNIVEDKAGRVIVNGFPTGVEVSSAMVHGGPYPASTNFGATSVGTMAIRRFLRLVCYQNLPSSLLPKDCRNA